MKRKYRKPVKRIKKPGENTIQKFIDKNPDNCTLKIPCPLVEKKCKDCWYDKNEIKRRELRDE